MLTGRGTDIEQITSILCELQYNYNACAEAVNEPQKCWYLNTLGIGLICSTCVVKGIKIQGHAESEEEVVVNEGFFKKFIIARGDTVTSKGALGEKKRIYILVKVQRRGQYYC